MAGAVATRRDDPRAARAETWPRPPELHRGPLAYGLVGSSWMGGCQAEDPLMPHQLRFPIPKHRMSIEGYANTAVGGRFGGD
jgi:hypothetical protein